MMGNIVVKEVDCEKRCEELYKADGEYQLGWKLSLMRSYY